jgi:hypothetical protein
MNAGRIFFQIQLLIDAKVSIGFGKISMGEYNCRILVSGHRSGQLLIAYVIVNGCKSRINITE